ncbi:MAG: hypothetical protein R3F49_11065 [Planctomycetota bacterium]
MHFALISLLALAPTALSQAEKPAPERAPSVALQGGIRDLITAPLFAEAGDGQVWVRGRDYRASFGPEGSTFLPVFGPAAAREYPVAFAVRSARVGEAQLAAAATRVERRGDAIALVHPDFTEVHLCGLDGVEQTFVFDSLPGAGDLVVELGVVTDLVPTVSSDGGLAFEHATLGRVEYGRAVAFDARGARTPVERVWTGDAIELRVPAAFVAGATLPLTIDPLVASFSNSFGSPDDSNPDVCWDGGHSCYWVVWSEYTSAVNRDVYITSFAPNGDQQSAFGVDMTNEDWEAPRVAYHHAGSRLLVVASRIAAGASAVVGQLIHTSMRATTGPVLTISAVGSRKRDADVGGDARSSHAAGSHFCVVWSREYSPSDYDVEYRIIDWDGTPVTPVVLVDATAADALGTTISQGQGRHGVGLDTWTIAWVQDAVGAGLGAIVARYIDATGALGTTSGNFIVEPATDCAAPSVTSRFQLALVADGQRPSIVSYERETNGVRSLHARVITDGHAYSPNPLSQVLQDVDPHLDRRDSRIAGGLRAFYLAYSQPYHGNVGGSDRDVYYMSGGISETSNDAFIALCERHVNLAFSAAPEGTPAVATRCDGSPSPFLDEGAVVWRSGGSATGGLIQGAVVDSPIDQNDFKWAVGRQFCDANANSRSSPYAATSSSWMWIYGNQGQVSQHVALCQDLPVNSMGYLLGALTPGDVNLAGGSQGRLCVLGAGRYVNLVQSSGSSGTFATSSYGQSYPTPNGFVTAQPGETWYFQYWHRDSVSGVATSNFSNACSMMIAP